MTAMTLEVVVRDPDHQVDGRWRVEGDFEEGLLLSTVRDLARLGMKGAEGTRQVEITGCTPQEVWGNILPRMIRV